MHRASLSEDILRQARASDPSQEYSDDIFNEALIVMKDLCMSINNKALCQLGMPAPTRDRNAVQDRDLMHRGKDQSMGGALILLAGDFRQTLPVIPRSTPADELNACLKASHLWNYVEKITLTTNMRVHLLQDTSAQIFSKQLLDIGNGKVHIDRTTNEISFPSNFCQMQQSIQDVIDRVFPNLMINYRIPEWLRERAILAPKNDDVSKLNGQIQLKIPGEAVEYKSIDTVMDKDQAVNYPTEFLNSLEPPGMPPHSLALKVGSPVMLIRNLNAPKLCNGTRVIIKKLTPNLIEATIISGKFKGEDVLIPRIPMIPNDLPFEFKRLQFPLRLAFAITINKAQGQSLTIAATRAGYC
ncbi:uncharacterized protein LOC118745044 [Rhagoletis pomonella]|uniref:uncharacterized protein LOC118745044 n=1 Tax=Rhagoletis pomonella TaxID=28610 RepID=UPI00177CD6FA|nr:uncharacterized protein LOC118745044 [Rhagoletis pomonella]